MKLSDYIHAFVSNLTTIRLRKKSLNYTDRSVGLRNPDSPVGVLANESGVSKLYAGKSEVLCSLTGDVIISSPEITLDGNINLQPDKLDGFKILGKHINPEVWKGDVKFIKHRDFAGLSFITPNTIVTPDGQILNTTPANEVLLGEYLYLEDTISNLDYEIAKEAAELIGIELPKWI